ncbi:MAG: hypothetical protein BWY06_01850 [Candidatus Latescibacteria bacterium ADurb.Bin168]|nr:MAG: hypothetical protein BWY06_01850 [Candidatus Latescibacteria bacterium ADurb.Bin168]
MEQFGFRGRSGRSFDARMSYRQFAEMAELHRRLVGQVDQRVGREKAILRKYIAAIDVALRNHPDANEFFARWRKESGMSDREA